MSSSRITPTPEQAVCSVVAERDGHFYAFIYLAGREAEILREVGNRARDPNLNFRWMDAAVVCKVTRSGKP